MDSRIHSHLPINSTWDGLPLSAHEKASVDLTWLDNGDLDINIDAPFAGDPKPNCHSQSCWGLWNYEVVELFIVGQGNPTPYTEIQVSPWGHHLVLQLLGTRNITVKQLPLTITSLNRKELRWQAHVVMAGKFLPAGELHVNAYRISGVEPNRCYHVMTPMHSAEPDFHLVEQFTEKLARLAD